MPWQWITVIARCTSIITTLPRQSQTADFLQPLMTLSVPWIAALPDICGAEQQFPLILIFPHRQ